MLSDRYNRYKQRSKGASMKFIVIFHYLFNVFTGIADLQIMYVMHNV